MAKVTKTGKDKARGQFLLLVMPPPFFFTFLSLEVDISLGHGKK